MTRNNLTTDGSEFVLPNGTPYTGLYHVHVDSGAMVGPRHSTVTHSTLIPVNDEAAQKVASIQAELRADQLRQSKIQSISSTPTVISSSSVSASGGGGGGGGY
jgi:hypothetical protein